MLEYSIFDTIVGPVGVVASPRGVREVRLRCPPHDIFEEEIKNKYESKITENHGNKFILKIGAQLNKYLSRKLKKFDIPLDARVSPFVEKVMSIVGEIPYGQLATYQEIAQKASSPKGARAVGRAVGANPLPIIIPCHRVITSAGTLGGYSAGLDIKAFLLSLELEKNALRRTF